MDTKIREYNKAAWYNISKDNLHLKDLHHYAIIPLFYISLSNKKAFGK